MKVAIIGAGAVGLGIGSGLSSRGVEVLYVVKRETLGRALAEKGISRTGLFGDLHVSPDRFDVTDSLAAIADAAADHWIVCTKATQTLELARDLAPIWHAINAAVSHGPHKSPSIVLCQNGWGIAETFSEWIPRENIFNARVITGFERVDATSVRVTVHADAIHMGSLHGADPRELEPLCAAIGAGGIPCKVSFEIEKDLWAKVLYNELLNPLGALVGVAYGVLGEQPLTRSIMEALAIETFSVMRAGGFETHWDSAEEYLAAFYAKLLPPTALHQSSMLRDLRGGHATEIEALCGVIAEIAEAHGVDAPINGALLTLVRAAERRGEE